MTTQQTYLYMMSERQNRIMMNNERMKEILKEIPEELIQSKKQKLKKLKQEIKQIEDQLEQNQVRRDEWQNSDKIISIAEEINTIVEDITELGQKRSVLKIMREVIRSKGKLTGFGKIAVFYKFYQKKKDVVREELNESLNMRNQIVPFIKLYRSIKKDQMHSNMSYESLTLLLEDYNQEEVDLLNQKEQTEQNYHDQIHFVRFYNQIQASLAEKKSLKLLEKEEEERQLATLIAGSQKKRDEIKSLQTLNQAYEDQITKLKEIYGSTKPIIQYQEYRKQKRRCS